MKITQNQAEIFLREDVTSHVRNMEKVISVPLNQNQYDALASFHFNLGPYILNGSLLLTFLNSRQWTAATNQMKLYVSGLKKFKSHHYFLTTFFVKKSRLYSA